jgi:hypothetical protein
LRHPLKRISHDDVDRDYREAWPREASDFDRCDSQWRKHENVAVRPVLPIPPVSGISGANHAHHQGLKFRPTL